VLTILFFSWSSFLCIEVHCLPLSVKIITMLSIFAALEAEVSEFKKGMTIFGTSTYQDCRIFEGRLAGRDVLLAVTGIGEERAKTAARYVLDKIPVSALVSSGFAGALNDKTAVGDMVIYTVLRCEQCREVSAGKPLQPDPILLTQCLKSGRECAIQVLSGRGISISRVCATPQDKSELGRDSGADSVDMESFWIGQIAAERNVPFIAVRSISDNLADDLSLLADITAGSRVKPLKALGHFIHHPTDLRTAALLLTNSRKAGKNLALFLDTVVKNI
jgi:adenosylhomocysteine nucleosidase